MRKYKKIIAIAISVITAIIILCTLLGLYFGGVIGTYRVKKITDFFGFKNFSSINIAGITGNFSGATEAVTVIEDDDEIKSVVEIIESGEYRLQTTTTLDGGTWLNITFDFKDGTSKTIDYRYISCGNNRYYKFTERNALYYCIYNIGIDHGDIFPFKFDDYDDYERSKTDCTVKEYTESSGIELLYFDLYDESIYCFDYIYKLKDSDDIYCYYEDFFFDEFEYFIEMWIFEECVGVEFSECILNLSVETQVINNTEVNWAFKDSDFYANLNHVGYGYFIHINCITSADSALEIMEKLF